MGGRGIARGGVLLDRALWPFYGLIAIGAVVRLALATGTDVYFDEAYYWTWSQRPALSYFDHPPLIAWLIAVFGVRPTALLCGVATVAAVYGFAADVHQSRPAGVRAAALWMTVPAGVLAGFIATPDAPLHLFWVLSLWALHRERWLWAGVLCGLALLSKYVAVLIAAAFVVRCVRERRLPRGAFATLGIAAVLFAPVVLWNWRHDWASFVFQLRHGLAGRGGAESFVEFVGGQFAMAGPVLLPLVLVFVARSRAPVLLRAATAVPLLFFAYASLRARGEANWAAMAYLSACVWLGGRDGLAVRAAAGLNAIVCVLGAAHLIHPFIHLRHDIPLARLQGWDELASLREYDAEVVFGPSYQLASQAWFHSGIPAQVVGGGRRSQYDFWELPELAPGGTALWVSDGPPPPLDVLVGYSLQGRAATVEGRHRGRTLNRFEVWRLERRR